nr:glycosyl transferase family 2 [uncultured Gammaproteobacteria bacterium]
MAEKVSILLATRNRKPLLARALASLRVQTHTALEILVLDDGSTDQTPELLERIAHEEPRLRWFRREHSQGLASALNFLLCQSSGAWLARMDDDDVAHPQRIAMQLAYMRNMQVDVCGCWYRRIAGWRRSVARPPVEHARIQAELLFQPPLLHPAVMFRREVFEQHGGYSESSPHAEDYELWIRLLPHVRFGNCPKVLMDYTLSPEQVSHRFNAQQVATARSLRIRALNQLNIPHSQAQAAVHAGLRDPTPIDTLPQLLEVHTWLANLSRHLQPLARAAVHRQWFLQCVRAAGLGPKVYCAYLSSPLATATPRQCSMLWALCQLRLRYRSPLYNQLEPLAGIG